MRPLVTCVVPAYNAERYLAATLDSILEQTYRPLDVLVIDDGSTDGTATVAAGYEADVRCIGQENQGCPGAMNRGIGEAAADFVAFLHADDLWHPDKLTLQMNVLLGRPEVDICVAHMQQFWDDDLADEAERYSEHRVAQPHPGYTGGAIVGGRAVFVDRVGLFDASLSHGWDLDWFMRAERTGITVELLPDVLLYHRAHRSSLSRSQPAEAREEYLHLLKSNIDHRRNSAKRQAD